jgi:hypothetical protein
MPRLDKDMKEGKINGLTAFRFSGVKIEKLKATEYTLVTIAVDVTGSVSGFEDDLRQALVTTIQACQKTPLSDNLLVRVLQFSTKVGVEELHGFKPLAEINPETDYPAFAPDGLTPLYDAVFSAVGAINTYAQELAADGFLANGIVFIITDGDDNYSTATPQMIKQEIKKARQREDLQSLLTILIGINAQEYSQELKNFSQTAGLDRFIDVGDITAEKLAQITNFISRSIYGQSRALVTGKDQDIVPLI